MARKVVSRKSEPLSQEYIIDSDSDGAAESDKSVHKISRNRNERASPKEKLKSGKVSSVASAARIQRPDSPDNDAMVTSMGNERGQSPSSSEGGGRKKETEDGGETEAAPKPQKSKRAPVYDLYQKAENKLTTSTRPEATPVLIPVRPFRPPPGFQEVRPAASDFSAEALETLAGDLAGKQIWHITAPASVPLNSISRINLDAVRSGHPILTHDKKQYGFDSGANVLEHLLLPDGAEFTYKHLKTAISRSYHLRQIPGVAQAARSSSQEPPAEIKQAQAENSSPREPPAELNFFATKLPSSIQPRKQPPMLKMCHQPFGTENSKAGPTDFTTRQERPVLEERSFQVSPPQSSGSPQPPDPESTPKKRRKHKRSSLGEGDGVEVNGPIEIDGTPTGEEEARKASSQTDRPGPPESSSTRKKRKREKTSVLVEREDEFVDVAMEIDERPTKEEEAGKEASPKSSPRKASLQTDLSISDSRGDMNGTGGDDAPVEKKKEKKRKKSRVEASSQISIS